MILIGHKMTICLIAVLSIIKYNCFAYQYLPRYLCPTNWLSETFDISKTTISTIFVYTFTPIFNITHSYVLSPVINLITVFQSDIGIGFQIFPLLAHLEYFTSHLFYWLYNGLIYLRYLLVNYIIECLFDYTIDLPFSWIWFLIIWIFENWLQQMFFQLFLIFTVVIPFITFEYIDTVHPSTIKEVYAIHPCIDYSFLQLIQNGSGLYIFEILKLQKRYDAKLDDNLRIHTIRHKKFAFNAGFEFCLFITGILIFPIICQYIFIGIKFYTGVQADFCMLVFLILAVKFYETLIVVVMCLQISKESGADMKQDLYRIYTGSIHPKANRLCVLLFSTHLLVKISFSYVFGFFN